MGRIATLLAPIALLACSGQVHEASIVLALEYPPPHEPAIESPPSPRESPDGLASPSFGFVKRYVEELNLDPMIDELDLRSKVTVEELERASSVEIRDELSILRVVPSSRFPADEVAVYLVQSAIGAFIEESVYALRRRGSFWLGESVRACVRERDEDSPRASLPRCAHACKGLAEVWIDSVLTRRQFGGELRVFDEPNRDPVPALGLRSDTVHATLFLDRGILSGVCQGVRADSDNLPHHLSRRLTAWRREPELSRIIDETGLYPDESASLERMAVIDMMQDAIAMTDLPGATQSERRFRLAFAYETREGAQRGVRALARALVAHHENALERCVEGARDFAASIEARRTGDWVEAVPHFEVRLNVPVMQEEAMRRSLWEACELWILEDIDRLRRSVDRMARSRPRLRTVGDVEPGGIVD